MVVAGLAVGFASSAPAPATPLPGAIEELPVPANERLELSELTVDSEGQPWFIETVNHDGFDSTISRLAPNGVVTYEDFLGWQSMARDIATGPEGDIWATVVRNGPEEPEREFDAITRITPAGEKVATFPIPDTTQRCCDFEIGPVAIAPGHEGDMWFTDQRPNSSGRAFIASITPDGKTVDEHPIPAGEAPDESVTPAPVGIAAGREGSIWFTDAGTNTKGQNLIGRLTPGGTITEYPIPTPGASPVAIFAGPDGNMWFTEVGVNAIGRITPGGAITEFPASSVGGGLQGIVLGTDGNLWFSTGWANRGFASISTSGVVHSVPELFSANGFAISLAEDAEGEIWFANPAWEDAAEEHHHVGRFTIPRLPVLTTLPAISGTAGEGRILTASPGTWQNSPAAIEYQWQRCDAAGNGCEDLPGEVAASRRLGGADVGHTLRVRVTASNLAGDAVAVTAPSPVVATGATLPATASRLPVVGATLTWHFPRAHGRVRVASLAVHGLTAGDRLHLECSGRGCSLRAGWPATKGAKACRASRCSWSYLASSAGALSLTAELAAARLGPGGRLTVVIVKPGALGIAYEFVVHRGGRVTKQIDCRTPDSFTERQEC